MSIDIKKSMKYAICTGLLWTMVGFFFGWPSALAGGSGLGLILTISLAVIAGKVLATCTGAPDLLGSLLAGLVLRNIPSPVDVGAWIDPQLASLLRACALVLILSRAGLGLDMDTLSRLGAAAVRLSTLPNACEAVIAACMLQAVWGFGWAWSFAGGFLLSAVSPAVVVPSVLRLQDEGLGTDEGVPTLVLAAASVDDVLSISGFGIALGIAMTNAGLSSSPDGHTSGGAAESAWRAPAELLSGLAFGVVGGIAFSVIWHPDADGAILRNGNTEIEVASVNGGASTHLPVAPQKVSEFSDAEVVGGSLAGPGDAPPTSMQGHQETTNAMQRSHQLQNAETNRVPDVQGVAIVAPTTGVGSPPASLAPLALFLLGCLAVLGGREIDLGGGGALAVLVLGVVVAAIWKAEDEESANADAGQPISIRPWYHSLTIAAMLVRRVAGIMCQCLCCFRAEATPVLVPTVGRDNLGVNHESSDQLDSPGNQDIEIGSSANAAPTNVSGTPAQTQDAAREHTKSGLRLLQDTSAALKEVWAFAQPVLFSLIGAAVDVRSISGEILAGCAAALFAGLCVRAAVAFLCVWGSGHLGLNEAAFISIAWLPKATVQAALGPVALDAVTNALASQANPTAGEERAISAGESLLALAVLSILLTAPAGAALIAYSGPRLLKQSAS